MADRKRGIRFVFSADTRQVSRATEDVEKAIEGLGPQAQEAARKLADSMGDEGLSSVRQGVRDTVDGLQKLGLRSELVANKQKQAAIDAFEKVKNSGVASAEEIARAEEALNRRLERIDRSLGRQTRRTAGLSEAWQALRRATAIAARAGRAAMEGWRRTVDGLRRALARVRAATSAIARTSWRAFTGGLRRARLAALGLTAGITAAAGAAARMTRQAARGFRDVENAAARAGLSVEQFQRFSFAGSRIGAEAEDISSTMQTLNERIVEFARLNQTTAREGFSALGIRRRDLVAGVQPFDASGEVLPEFRDADGTLDVLKFYAEGGRFLDAAAVFDRMAASISTMEDGALRTQILFSLLGDDARYVVPLLEKGSGAVEKMAEEGERLGVIVDESRIDRSRQLAVAFTGVAQSGRGLLNRIAFRLYDDIEARLKSLRKLLVDNGDAIVDAVVRTFRGAARAADEALAFAGRAAEIVRERIVVPLDVDLGRLLAGSRGELDGRALADRLEPLARFVGDRLPGAFRTARGAWRDFTHGFEFGRSPVRSSVAGDLGRLASDVAGLFQPGFAGAPSPVGRFIGEMRDQVPRALELARGFVSELTAIFTGGDTSSEFGARVQQGVRDVLAILRKARTVLEDLQPVISKVSELLAPLLEKISELFGFRAVASAGVLLLFARMTGALQGIRSLIGGVIRLSGRLVGGGLLAWLGRVAGGLVAGGLTATAAASPAGWVAAAIAGIGLLYGALRATDTWDDVVEFFGTTLPDAIGDAISALGRLIGQLSDGALRALGLRDAEATAPAGYAGGGFVRGPGTSTSDSVIARLSRGEYVLRADSVRRVGTDLLDALNTGVLPGFATGGLIAPPPVPVPTTSAMEPAVGGWGSLTVNVPGVDRPIRGRVDRDEAREVRRSLRRASLARSADKPRHY